MYWKRKAKRHCGVGKRLGVRGYYSTDKHILLKIRMENGKLFNTLGSNKIVFDMGKKLRQKRVIQVEKTM